MSGISNDVTYSLRQDISEKIHRMPLKYFESKPTGEVLSRITNDVDTLGPVSYTHLDVYKRQKYYYEAAEMALIDTDVRRTFATGIAGFSHVVDSLSAIKYAKVKTVRDETGLVVDYEIEGDFPRYGNDDDRADEIATWLLDTFMSKLRYCHTYRDSEPTTSILTITSNAVSYTHLILYHSKS